MRLYLFLSRVQYVRRGAKSFNATLAEFPQPEDNEIALRAEFWRKSKFWKISKHVRDIIDTKLGFLERITIYKLSTWT